MLHNKQIATLAAAAAQAILAHAEAGHDDDEGCEHEDLGDEQSDIEADDFDHDCEEEEGMQNPSEGYAVGRKAKPSPMTSGRLAGFQGRAARALARVLHLRQRRVQ